MKFSFVADKLQERQRLNIFLRENGVSAALIKKIKFTPDGILVNGEKKNTDYMVQPGDIVEINTADEDMDSTVIPQRGEMNIVYMDDCCMVVDKPYDMPCHPSFNHPTDTIANYFMGYWQDRGESKICRIINRLDRNTSGLVLIALDAHSAEKFKGKVDKTYTAVIAGCPETIHGVIDLPIARQEESIITRCVREDGQRAVTEYNVVKTDGQLSLLDIKLHTGRTHQIRVHFSHLGYSLEGDELYGGNMSNINRHALHCSVLRFPAVTGEGYVEVRSELPQDMQELVNKIGKNSL
ncbi:MAG: RluA family pseudouridine synthase [Oscillospiraceae bacterium]|nr:RluA family pseudouridine synthase [Oscillospiraceae bacterium]